MLKLATVIILPVIILALLEDGVLVDNIHGYHVMYDMYFDAIVFVSNVDCYIVEFPDGSWEEIMRSEDDIYTVTDDIYSQIMDGIGITSLTQAEASEEYGSRLAVWICIHKDIHKVSYFD